MGGVAHYDGTPLPGSDEAQRLLVDALRAG